MDVYNVDVFQKRQVSMQCAWYTQCVYTPIALVALQVGSDKDHLTTLFILKTTRCLVPLTENTLDTCELPSKDGDRC